MKGAVVVCFAWLLLVPVAGCLFSVTAQTAMPDLSVALDSLLGANYKANQPGAALLVMRGEKILYQRGVGLANAATRQANTPQTNFRMASVSKQFTATAIWLLAGQGKLALEDNLVRFFPGFGAAGRRVTLRHLLTHSSGLADYESLMKQPAAGQLSDRAVLDLVAPLDKGYFEPGTAFRYSNTGFVLLGLVVEKVTGQSLAAFMQAHLFQPLRMRETVLYQQGKPIAHRALGYARKANGEFFFSDQSPTSATGGDGGVYTSLGDYLRWHQALDLPGSFALAPALDSVFYPIKGTNHYYGMGWFFAKRPDGSYEMFHTGDTCGFSNLVIRVPAQGVLVAYFTNIADNPYLLNDFLRVLKRFPAVYPQTDLLEALPALTR
jgi:CubicO group peptidase (beta-lactamase class C family)